MRHGRMPQVQAAAAGAMGLLGLAAGAIGFYGVAPAQLLTVTSVFSVFMVCSAAGEQICCNLRPYPQIKHRAGWMSHQG